MLATYYITVKSPILIYTEKHHYLCGIKTVPSFLIMY